MEPRFHRGDLALVRAEDTYRVGEIVAYHSTLLHVTVLHRIIGRDGNRYVFKGDNNHFIDPTHPTRAELLGALWLHVPRAGVALKLLHSPVGAATLCALVGLVLLLGGRREQRRRRRRRAGPASGAGRPGAASMKAVIDHDARRPLNWSALLTASAIAGAVFVVIGLFALTRPAHKPSAVKTPYVQRVTFAYSARVHPGAVYPTGLIHTGDPIFPQLVHRLDLHLDYRLTSAAPHAVRGTEDVVLQLTGPGGWNRQIVLAPRTAFDADHTSTDVTLDLPYVESLFQQVARVTGVLGGTYTVAVEPRVHVIGTVAGDAVQTSYAPSLRFQLNATQLLPSGGSSTSGGSSSGFSQQQSASVGTPATAANAFKIGGVSVEIPLLRWISLIGLLLSAVASAFFYLRKRGEPFEETFRIQAQYGHLIVPIVGGEDLGWPPVDVPSIKALVRLAESGQRLILHSRSNDIDTYLVNDEGTVYRYQVKPSKVIWGEWSETAEPVKLAA
jgi:hypothetical protein